MKRGGNFEKLHHELLQANYRLCAIHFNNDQYKNVERTKLRDDAIPKYNS